MTRSRRAAPGIFAGEGRHEWYFRSPDGESYAALAARLGEWLAEQDESMAIIVVAHGLVSRVLRGLYGGLPRAGRADPAGAARPGLPARRWRDRRARPVRSLRGPARLVRLQLRPGSGFGKEGGEQSPARGARGLPAGDHVPLDRGEPAGDRGGGAEMLDQAVVDLGPQAPPAPARGAAAAQLPDASSAARNRATSSHTSATPLPSSAETARTGTCHSGSGGRISRNARWHNRRPRAAPPRRTRHRPC